MTQEEYQDAVKEAQLCFIDDFKRLLKKYLMDCFPDLYERIDYDILTPGEIKKAEDKIFEDVFGGRQ